MIRYRISAYYDSNPIVEYFGKHYKGVETIHPDGQISEEQFEREVMPRLDVQDKSYWIGHGYATAEIGS